MHADVLVTGVFELERLEWLSDQGQETLVRWIRDRDDEYKSHGAPKRAISLRSLFVSPELTAKVRIRIAFVKNMLATYALIKNKGRYINLKSR